MKVVKLLHRETRKTLADHIRIADNFGSRLAGLLFSRELQEGSGLWLIPCRSIHMFGMRYPIDVIYLNQTNQVIHMIQNLKPNSFPPASPQAHSVLELPAGFLKKHSISLQDTLQPV